MSKPKNVLWTGGWDSTYRIIQLVRSGIEIQPIYVFDKTRSSKYKELETIEKLEEIILNRYSPNQDLIKALKIVNKKKISKDPFIYFAFKKLKKRDHLGGQYYWLARLAKKIKNLELSIHSNDFRFLKGKVITKKDDFGIEYNILDPKVKDFALQQIFGRMVFPITDLTKLQMKDVADKEGFLDILLKTWFCHNSDNKPCGKCGPCKQYRIDGFGFRVDE